MTSAERRVAIFRHAKSERSAGVPDLDRPLAERGRRDAPAVGRWLRAELPSIDLVLCSPAVRARQTWELASAELVSPPPVEHDERLYGRGAGELLTVLRALPEDVKTVVLVGHNPELEQLMTLLTGVGGELKTSSLAVLAGPGGWADVGPRWAELDILTTPRG